MPVVRDHGVVRDSNSTDFDFQNGLAVDAIAPGVVAIYIPNNGIINAMLADASVTLAKVADASVNSAKVIDGSLQAVDLAAGVVPDYRVLYKPVTTETITGVLVLTDFITNRATIPANDAAVGTAYRLLARGTAQNTTGAGRTFRLSLRLAGVTIAQTANQNIPATSTVQWEVRALLIVTALGTPGAVEVQGYAIIDQTNQPMVNTATQAMNTVNANTLGLAVTHEVSSQIAVQRQIVVERL